VRERHTATKKDIKDFEGLQTPHPFFFVI